jgi:methylated-DNA-protein-cysteine methyltransferase-like protein
VPKAFEATSAPEDGRSFRTESFHQRAVSVIKKIPPGRVATYGQIAAMAGNPKASRQVSRILHSSSRKENLPWHRVINSKGGISLPRGHGYELQKSLLQDEGVEFHDGGRVDLKSYGWQPHGPATAEMRFL